MNLFLKRNKWLISCCNEGGGLFKLDKNSGASRKVIDEDCRGIAKYRAGFVLATTSAGILLLNNKLEVIKRANSTERGFHPVLDFHGVAVKGDFAYVVETHRNAIGVFRLPDLEKVRDIQLHPTEEDVLHINDLFIDGDSLFVSMFSLEGPWRPTFDRPSGGIKEFNLSTMELINTHFPGSIHHPHSVQLHQGKLLYCSSFPGLVMHGEDILFKTSAYARGLHFDAKCIGIGNSCSRNNGKEDEKAGVYIYSRSDKTSRFFELPVKEIYGILAL